MPITLIYDRNVTLAYKHFGVTDRSQVVSEMEQLLGVSLETGQQKRGKLTA